MQNTETVGTKTVRRAAVIVLLVCLIFSFLMARIFIYETVDYDKYQQKVLTQMTTEINSAAARGLIYDRNGVVLAGNITTYRIFISPSAIASGQGKLDPTSDENIAQVIAKGLSELLGVSYDKVLEQAGMTRYLDRTVANRVDDETTERVREFISEHGYQNYIFTEASSSRYYPYSTLASHVLGFTGTDGGSIGLELKYDEILKGTDGKYVVARDARGNEMPNDYEAYIPAVNGNNLVTTLDIHVQSVLEEELKLIYDTTGSKRVTGIVMDVNNGEVLGLANYPDFDLNHPGTLNDEMQTVLTLSGLKPDTEEYDKLKSELMMEMWRNEATSDSYTPGSTFKIITACMALEENLVSLSDTVSCGGSMTIAGQKISCHKVRGHGSLTFAEGIQQSCNVWLMSLSQRFGLTAETFYKYFKTFGYTEKTGIDLPGEGNSTFWPLEDFLKSPLDLPIASFGQNFNVTAIQQITAVAAVANGGYLVTPHLMKEVTDSDGKTVTAYGDATKRQTVSAETCATITKILEEGVSGNGGAKNAYVAGYRVAAKTGTAEKEPKNENKYLCSCVGYAPADDPQYAILIIADEPSVSGYQYGSTAAAPFLADVLEQILPYLGVEAVYSEKEQEKMQVTVPNLTSWSVKLATEYAADLGIAVEVVGDGAYVTSQTPARNTVMQKTDGVVVLYTGNEKPAESIRVPDVTGLGSLAANQLIINAGLNLRITGNQGQKVLSQSIPAGTEVSPGTVITLIFGSEDPD